MGGRRFDIRDALGREDFRVWVGTLLETLGLTVTVVDADASDVLFVGPRGPHCAVILGAEPAEPYTDCFDSTPPVDGAEVTRSFCRAGMPCYFAPVAVRDTIECYVMVQGFVTSTRERRRLFESLLGAGTSEAAAREALKDIPVYSHGRAVRFARMIAAHAAAIVEAERAGARVAERVDRLEELLETARVFLEAPASPGELNHVLLERSMKMLGADDGVLLRVRPGTDFMDVVAARGTGAEGVGPGPYRLGEGVVGKVAYSGESAITGAGSDCGPAMLASSTSVCVPLRRDGVIKGVLEIGFADGRRELGEADVAALEDYASIAAGGIERAARRTESEREFLELMQVDEFSQVLQGDLGVDDVVRVAASVLEKSLDFGIGGVVFTGHSSDSATLVIRSDVSRGDADMVFDDACGASLDEVGDVTFVTHLGVLSESSETTREWTVLSVPLTVRNVGIGYLFVASHGSQVFDAAAERLMWRLASHIAPAFDRAMLFARLRDDYARTIAALSAALDAGERRDAGHSARVMDYAMAIGEAMGLDPQQVELLRFAGLLHDIGKVGVAQEILLKPSKLTDGEMAEARMHAQLGASLVEQVDFLNAIAPIILHHHERWDGKGYPMHLVAEQTPLLARILAVADAYDSMTVAAPYRSPMSDAEARNELRAGSGSQFDPRVVDAMLLVLERYVAAGMTGMLSETARRGWLPA